MPKGAPQQFTDLRGASLKHQGDALVAEGAYSCAAVRKPPSGKPKFGAPKKAGAKLGGLGVKKMTTRVDDSVFEQAPVEDPPPAAALSALGPTLSVRPNAMQCLSPQQTQALLQQSQTR